MTNDDTAANTLEITADLAEAAEAILENFAEDAELDVALVVEDSGSLIAGISADDGIDVHTVSALVAGNIGASRALGKVVGETGGVESMSQGTDRVTYLRELDDKFVLVGIADADLPPGIVREKAAQISGKLTALLQGKNGDAEEEKPDPEKSEEEKSEPEKKTDVFAGTPFALADDEEKAEPDAPDEASEKPKSNLVLPSLPAIQPLVVNSPFEIALDDEVDDDEPETDEAEVEDEKPIHEKRSIHSFFKPAEDESAPTEPDSETIVETEKPAIESIFELADDEEEEDEVEESADDPSVSAPMLVTPALPADAKQEQEGEDDVAPISNPIATDIAQKDDETEPQRDAEIEDEDDGDDEPVGGPRYVFEIG